MKKFLSIVAVLSVFFLSSCNSRQQAVSFNDKLVFIQKAFSREVDIAKLTVQDEVARYKRIKEISRRKIEEIKAVKAPSDGEAFKMAMIDDIQLVYDIFDVSIKLGDEKLKEDEIKKLEAELDALRAKIDKYDDKVLEEQKKFAKANHFTLEKR